MKTQKDLIAKPWSKISADWKKTVTPPMSPSPDDKKIYAKWIATLYQNKKSKFNVLILGSTPEIRDLFGKYPEASVSVCDINKDHYLAMTELTKSAHPKERFVYSEWSALDLKESSFDLIIGDGIIANVAKKNKKRFMTMMSSALKKNGLMIVREICINKTKLVSIDKMLKSFAEYKADKWSPMELLISLELAIYNKETGIVSMPKILAHLQKKYFDKKSGIYDFFGNESMKKILNHQTITKWTAINKEWDLADAVETKILIEKYFKIVSVDHAADHLSHPTCGIFGDVMPIFTLAKK